MKITLLGSGAWDGIPAPFCDCPICANAAGKDVRMRPALLIEGPSGRFMVESSPDIRLQSARFGLSDIRDFVISHWHFDHAYGLLEMDALAAADVPLRVFCSRKTADWLSSAMPHVKRQDVIVEAYRPFELAGVRVTPLPVNHMAQDLGSSPRDNTFGFLFESGGVSLAYLSDYYELPAETLAAAARADIVVADGTYLLREVFPDSPLARLTADDRTHIHGRAVTDAIAGLPGRKVFHSVSHLCGMTHEAIAVHLPKGYSPGYDGMVLVNSK